jgi:hypothetical protein
VGLGWRGYTARRTEAAAQAALPVAVTVRPTRKYSNGRACYLRAIAFHKKGELSEALRDYQAGCAEGCASCCNFAR